MEKLIIERLKKGEESAFRYIYDNHYVLLCRFANQLLNDAVLAEEIVGDVIFTIWEQHEKIEITHSIRAYLMRAVRNHCINKINSLSYRAEVRMSNFLLPENMDFLDAVFVDEHHPLGELLEQELEDELHRCIESLPEECRRVFKKSRFEQKKYEEIAGELNISVNTVKYHIKNALSYIQAHMSTYLRLLVLYIWGNF